eukprot:SAG31_NODE_1500_length_8090_cov_10.522588_5_plen_72_part_00
MAPSISKSTCLHLVIRRHAVDLVCTVSVTSSMMRWSAEVMQRLAQYTSRMAGPGLVYLCPVWQCLLRVFSD